MASKKIFFQQAEVEEELHTEIVNIPKSSPTNPAVQPDLEDKQKRWLIVGICLQSVLSPVLRKFVEPTVQQLFNSLKQTYSIDTQTFNNYLQIYPPGYPPGCRELNYEAINNNKNIPWFRGRKDLRRYDFKVSNHVDFSKLFLITSMTHFTAFDETCDLSALLGIVINIVTFPPVVQNVSQKVRSDVRNAWAHCNFDEWDSILYQTSFQLMHQLIKCLNLSTSEESTVLADLTKWETNGFMFLQGYAVGLEVVKDIRQQTHLLAKYALKMKTEGDITFNNVHLALEITHKEIDSACERIERLETRQSEHETSIGKLGNDVTFLYERTTDIQNSQKDQEIHLKEVISSIKVIDENVGELRSESAGTINRVESLENQTQKINQDITKITSDITDIKSDVHEFKIYMSSNKPSGKVFFYPPNRIVSFVGRERELGIIQESFVQNRNSLHTQVITGLGGCGKTTLAIEFSWRYQEFYPGGVYWMSAESDEALNDSITTLAIDVGTTGNNSNETLKRTLKWLSDLTEGWLLIVDNLDEDSISGNVKELLLGSWKRNAHGHVIVTTRREPITVEEHLLVDRSHCLELNAFQNSEGIEFIKLRIGIVSSQDDETILQLDEALGSLPLALEQAAAHIKITKCSVKDYMKRFEKKRLKLLKALPDTQKISKARLSVTTTWQLNIDYIRKQSEDEGLGTAAITVMRIASFLYADDIPKVIFNTGSPLVEDEVVKDALEDQMGTNQILEILTRFSLFQHSREDSLSVHRLVQEVIRDSVGDSDRQFILQSAVRMVKKALNISTSPLDVLHVGDSDRRKSGSLILWNKLAANSNMLKEHLTVFTKKINSDCDLLFNKETLTLLQTTAVYHSLYQRQAKALQDQEQMLHIMTVLSVSKKDYKELTSIKIPLFPKDRALIQDCLTSMIFVEAENDKNKVPVMEWDSEALRLKGNEESKKRNYHAALRYYTEAIKFCSSDQVDYRTYSNRSRTYMIIKDHEHALEDANKCIEIAPTFWKGYCWKAYAIASLIEKRSLPQAMEAVGLASACIAAHLNKSCLFEFKMKINYPVINFKIIVESGNLGDEIMELKDRPFTTLLLKKGRYTLSTGAYTLKSVEVIGIDDGVEIDTGPCLAICRLPKAEYPVDIEPEQTIKAHFENIFFVEGGAQITVTDNSIGTFYKCKFSNGKKGCVAFPRCQGGKGCINPNKCKQSVHINQYQLFASAKSGETGYAGLCVSRGGTAYLDHCIFDRCGGGGVLSSGEGSLVEISNCTLRNLPQMGIEARDFGAVKATNNKIIANRFHGVAIGPKGIGYLSGNFIQGNGYEGVWSGGILDDDEKRSGLGIMNLEGGSKAVIVDNIISQNGLSGLSFDGGTFDVRGNKIFENWLWGMMIKSRSSSYVLNNEVFENKCGGIRIGHNYSASVVIDGNTIRDHSGPDLYAVNSVEKLLPKEKFQPAGEVYGYTRPPIITSTNIRRNNEKGIQHPKVMVDLIETCCFCQERSKGLKRCTNCKKAAYCSKECQTNHWKRHKHMCKFLQDSYSIEIQMKDTVPFTPAGGIRTFSSKLIGIREGPPPDRKSSKRFILKIQSGKEYGQYDPNKLLLVYDQSVTVDVQFSNPMLYHLCCECGILAGEKLSTKKIFCWASFKNNGNTLCFHTDNLPPFQTW